MKKVVMVIAIFAALSFLVSLLAVAPSFAAKATQTQPTTKQQTQQGTVQTPASQDIKKPAGFKPTAMENPKATFWDLEVDHCVLNGVTVQGTIGKAGGSDPPANCCTATVKVGQTANFICYYKVKTPPIDSITEADVSAWGTGKSFSVGSIIGPLGVENKTLPQFTWQNVQGWKRAGKHIMIWSWSIASTVTPTPAHTAEPNKIWFYVDGLNEIRELSEEDNSYIGFFKVTP